MPPDLGWTHPIGWAEPGFTTMGNNLCSLFRSVQNQTKSYVNHETKNLKNHIIFAI